MTDLSDTVLAKSDQLNADDLIGGPITVTITRCTKLKDPDQPISISYDGDGGKPYKPGKSMRRVLIAIWGKNGDNYVGRSLTLYRDPEVTFGKLKVGGIRISHATDINGTQKPVITVKQGQKREFVVEPLRMQQQQQQAKAEPTIEGAREAIAGAADTAKLERIWHSANMEAFRADLRAEYDERKAELDQPAPAAAENGDWNV